MSQPPAQQPPTVPIDGGAAFPQASGEEYALVEGQRGMTLRDWFAGQALAGLLANSVLSTASDVDFGVMAYRAADAMLAERAKA